MKENIRKCICEFIGTAVLVLFGCGTAAITGGSIIPTSLAFGLSIISMAYVIGNISGCHVNPAVSLAMLINKKINIKEFCFYVVAQILGALAGAGILYGLMQTSSLLDVSELGLGANGFGDSSLANVNMIGALIVEAILTFVFVYTILGVTSDRKKASVAGIVIGLTLTFVHILGIPLTGTSVNPARSLAPAILLTGEALKQVWVFVVGPFVGSAIAAFVFKFLNKEEVSE